MSDHRTRTRCELGTDRASHALPQNFSPNFTTLAFPSCVSGNYVGGVSNLRFSSLLPSRNLGQTNAGEILVSVFLQKNICLEIEAPLFRELFAFRGAERNKSYLLAFFPVSLSLCIHKLAFLCSSVSAPFSRIPFCVLYFSSAWLLSMRETVVHIYVVCFSKSMES